MNLAFGNVANLRPAARAAFGHARGKASLLWVQLFGEKTWRVGSSLRAGTVRARRKTPSLNTAACCIAEHSTNFNPQAAPFIEQRHYHLLVQNLPSCSAKLQTCRN